MTHFQSPPSSKAAVRRSGRAIAAGNETALDIELVDRWRSSHAYVINTFQIFLKRRIEKFGVEAEFAQRLKRRRTVLDKLLRTRPDGTPLISDVTTMNDFAGCRLIFNSFDDLRRFREFVSSSRSLSNVLHSLKYDRDKYDYIDRPKPTGYRGIHDVFVHRPRPHRGNDHGSLPWHGLLVEVQYRTRVQHAWATALEISDIIDGQRTKFALADDDRVRFFALASEILARVYEGVARAFPDVETAALITMLNDAEADLRILQRLDALRQFEGYENIKRHNVLNIVAEPDDGYHLEVLNFKNSAEAIEATKLLEMDDRSLNAVYVRADNPQQVRSAYRNYFNDPIDFVRLVREAV